jgi:hypothetical protein
MRLEGGGQLGRLTQILKVWEMVEGVRFTGNCGRWRKVNTLDGQLRKRQRCRDKELEGGQY